MNFDFTEDIKDGHQAEEYVLSIIKKKYPKARRIKGYHPYYDIEVPEIGITIEVKRDFKSKETGNVFIETAYDNKPSGISTSTADFWAFVTHLGIMWVDTSALRYWLRKEREHSYPPKGKDKERTGKLISLVKLESLI